MHVIHCPACAAGLRLPRATLAKSARRICCTICEHRWVEPRLPLCEVASFKIPMVEAPTAPEISLLAQSSSVCPQSPNEKAAKSDSAAQGEKAPKKRNDIARGGRQPLIPRSLSQMTAACVATLLVLFCIVKRDAIVRAAPMLAGAYATIGTPVNLTGLQWRDVKTIVTQEASHRVLAVEGEIRNLRDKSQSIPEIKLSLRDDDGREVYHWSTPAPKASLERNETIRFQTRLVSPPAYARALRVQFAQSPDER